MYKLLFKKQTLLRFEAGLFASKAIPQTTVPQRHSAYEFENFTLKFFEHY